DCPCAIHIRLMAAKRKTRNNAPLGRCVPMVANNRLFIPGYRWISLSSYLSAPITGRGTGVGRGLGVGTGLGVGVGVDAGPPPFAVHRIVPLSPTAIPRNASVAKETSLRLAEVPLT